jgi:hypothetical protein
MLKRGVDGTFKAQDAIACMLHFGQVVSHGRFLRRLGKADALKASHVTEGPGFGAVWWLLSLAQQELAQPIAGVVLILFCGLSGPHQMARSLVRRIGYPTGVSS